MVRLGSIAFINSLPVDLAIVKGIVPSNVEIVSGSPAALNEKILSGELEISPVSVFWYAQHQKKFLLLPDLSISSESGVMSVLLFSRYRLEEMKGRRIAWTGEGRTTPALLEMICRLRYGFTPQFKLIPSGAGGIPEDCDAILLIGDQALVMKERLADSGLQIIDLAEHWKAWTKRPIVFAVWAARRDFFLDHPDEVLQTHKVILKSKQWGLAHLIEVIEEAKNKTGLPETILKSYFSQLSYDFDERLREGMRFYFDTATKCGLIEPVRELEDITEAVGAR